MDEFLSKLSYEQRRRLVTGAVQNFNLSQGNLSDAIKTETRKEFSKRIAKVNEDATFIKDYVGGLFGFLFEMLPPVRMLAMLENGLTKYLSKPEGYEVIAQLVGCTVDELIQGTGVFDNLGAGTTSFINGKTKDLLTSAMVSCAGSVTTLTQAADMAIVVIEQMAVRVREAYNGLNAEAAIYASIDGNTYPSEADKIAAFKQLLQIKINDTNSVNNQSQQNTNQSQNTNKSRYLGDIELVYWMSKYDYSNCNRDNSSNSKELDDVVQTFVNNAINLLDCMKIARNKTASSTLFELVSFQDNPLRYYVAKASYTVYPVADPAKKTRFDYTIHYLLPVEFGAVVLTHLRGTLHYTNLPLKLSSLKKTAKGTYFACTYDYQSRQPRPDTIFMMNLKTPPDENLHWYIELDKNLIQMNGNLVTETWFNPASMEYLFRDWAIDISNRKLPANYALVEQKLGSVVKSNADISKVLIAARLLKAMAN